MSFTAVSYYRLAIGWVETESLAMRIGHGNARRSPTTTTNHNTTTTTTTTTATNGDNEHYNNT